MLKTMPKKAVEFLESRGYVSNDEIRDLVAGFTSTDVLLDSEDLILFTEIIEKEMKLERE
jgi:hypothetical protein